MCKKFKSKTRINLRELINLIFLLMIRIEKTELNYLIFGRVVIEESEDKNNSNLHNPLNILNNITDVEDAQRIDKLKNKLRRKIV
jgi:hypothetical protein